MNIVGIIAVTAMSLVGIDNGHYQTTGDTPSWCKVPGPFIRELRELQDVRVVHLKDKAKTKAVRALTRRASIRLDKRSYFKMVDRLDYDARYKYVYLSRGGFMAPSNLPDYQIGEVGRSLDFSAYEGDGQGSVELVTLLTSSSPQVPRNIPVIILSPRPIYDVVPRCLGGR